MFHKLELLDNQESQTKKQTDFFRSLLSSRDVKLDTLWASSPLMQDIKRSFETFDLKAEDAGEPRGQIPKILHFIWLGSPAPKHVLFCMNSWEKKHPDFEIKLWDEKAVSSLCWENERIAEAYTKASSYAEKADYLRMQVLFIYGGIYIDTDVLCLKSFDVIINSGVLFFAGFEMPNAWAESQIYLCNALMGSVPNSLLIRRYFDLFVTSSEAPSKSPNERTGPGILSRMVETAFCEDSSEGILLLPCSYFYPTPYEWDLKQIEQDFKTFEGMIKPETMAVHFWSKSWK